MCCPDAEFKDKKGEEAQPQSCRQQNNEDASYCKLQNGNEEMQHKAGKREIFDHCHPLKVARCVKM